MKKIYKLLSLGLALCVMCASLLIGSGAIAFAGVSNLAVFESTELENASALSSTLWLFDKKDASGTYVQNNEIGFEPTKSDARFNLKRRIEDLAYCGVDLNFEMSAKFLLTDMPSNVRFVFAFGMPKVGAFPAEDGCIALYFENKNDVVGFGLAKYEDGNATDIVEFTPINGFNVNQYVDVVCSVYSDKTLKATINGTEITAQDMPTVGFVGFGQIAKGLKTVTVKIKDLGVRGFINDKPENSNCFEDFNDGCFNMKMFQSSCKTGGVGNSKVTVENGALRFNNTGEAYFESVYKYSNIDLAFDVTDVQKVNTFNEDGSIDTIRSCSFGAVFGINVAGKGMQKKDTPLEIQFVPHRDAKTTTTVQLKSYNNVIHTVELPEKFNMFAVDGPFNVKISVNDSIVKVMIKTANEKGYTTVVDYNLGFTPLGYFQIAALGAYNSNLQKHLGAEQVIVGSFSIDNLAVKNNDVGGTLKLVEYMSSNTAMPEDFIYENDWSDDDLLHSTIIGG